MNIPYHKIDSRLLEFDIDSIEFKFGMWITKKEFGQRLNQNKPLPKGQFFMSVRVVSKDIEITEKIARRLIKQFTKLDIIRLISTSKNPKEGSIYEYLVQVEKGTVEDTVRAQLGHSKSEKIRGFEGSEGHSKGTYKGTVEGTSKKKSKRKENNNIYSSDLAEEIWKAYPCKKGKARSIELINKILKSISKEELLRCIERYKEDVENQRANGFKTLAYKNGSTFFNGGYVDYLDKNYQEDEINNNEEDTEEYFSI